MLQSLAQPAIRTAAAFLFSVLLWTVSAHAALLDHSAWDRLLKNYVSGDSLVDYGLLELEPFLARFGPSCAKPFLESVETQPVIRYISYRWGLNDAAGLGENYDHIQLGAALAASGDLWTKVTDWFFGLGKEYGVDPVIFGAIYVGAIPFFSLSIGWLVRNLRRGKSPVLPLLCASFCFVSAYLYLLIAGKNIPVWVYAFLAAMVVFGVVSTVRKVRSQVGKGKVHEVRS